MSDPSGGLLPVIMAALKADTALAGIMSGKVKVYNVAPTNAVTPYIIVTGGKVDPVLAECFDLADAEVTADVWSLTDPAGQAQAMAIANASQAVMLGDLSVPGFVISSIPVHVTHLVDPRDGKTAHSIVGVRYAADPV